MEVSLSISGHFKNFDGPRGCGDIAGVGHIAVSFPLGSTLSPGCTQELFEFLTHDFFDDDSHRTARQCTEMFMERWLVGQRWRCLLQCYRASVGCGTLFLR